MNAYALSPETFVLIGLSLAAGLVVVNLLTFAAFAVDKRRSQTGEWRIPETTLLTLAALGGWPAAKLAQRTLRHKTRKEPFRTMLNMVALPMVAIVAVVGFQGFNFAAIASRATEFYQQQTASTDPAANTAAPAAAALPRRIGPGSDVKSDGKCRFTGAWKSK